MLRQNYERMSKKGRHRLAHFLIDFQYVWADGPQGVPLHMMVGRTAAYYGRIVEGSKTASRGGCN